MISYEEALSLVAAHVAPLPPKPGEPRLMLGCRLAAPLVAPAPLPQWDDSAMDGFAIRAATVAGASREAPAWLEVPVEATPIATGDPVPEGVDSVVPQELARREGDRIAVLLPVARGANIRRRGEDVSPGRELLPAGAVVDATVVLTAAALGLETLPIRPRLRAAVLPVGDHVASGRPDATGVAIHAALAGLGADSTLLGPVAGTADDVAARIRSALLEPVAGMSDEVPARAAFVDAAADMSDEVAARAALPGTLASPADGAMARGRDATACVDLLVTVGAASVGAGDTVPSALEAMGASRIFQGVSIKPGKPVGLWAWGAARILVLPGSPAAALACFDSIGRSVCERFGGGEPTRPLHAVAGSPIERRRGKTGLLRGRLVSGPGGLRFFAAAKQGPSQVSAVAGTNALAVIPPQVDSIATGAPVRVLCLGAIHTEEFAGEPSRIPSPGAVPAEDSAGPPAVVICGLSGSGKTWVMERLIARFSAQGLRVATVKHDAHGFEADPPGKDTARHRAAGAIATALVGPSRTAVVSERELSIEEAIRRVAVGADLVLVEGFKGDRTLPKIEIAARGRERVHAAPLLALVTDVPDASLSDAPVLGTGEEEIHRLSGIVIDAVGL